MSDSTKPLLAAEIGLKIVRKVLLHALENVPVGDLVMCFTENWPTTNWGSVFEASECEFAQAAFYTVIDPLRTYGNDLVKEVFKPLLLEKLTETLGAKSISIEW